MGQEHDTVASAVVDSTLANYPLLQAYLQIVVPVTEAPLRFHEAAAMSLVGTVVGRRTVLQFGPHTTLPVLPLVLLGPSGIGKSEALNCARRFLRILRPEIPLLGDEATPQALAEHLALNSHLQPWEADEDAELAVFAGEMSTLLNKKRENEGMLALLTKLLEYDDTHIRALVRKLKAGESSSIRNPTLSLFAGSTVDWLREMMPAGVFSGGFMRRIMIVLEPTKGRIMEKWPEPLHDQRLWELLPMWNVLRHKPPPVMKPSANAEKFFMQWRAAHSEKQPHDVSLAGHHNSMPQHVLRLSLILALADSSDVIAVRHLKDALRITGQMQHDAKTLLSKSHSMKDFSGMTRTLETVMADKPDIPTQELRRILRCPSNTFGELIDWGTNTGLLKQSSNGTVSLAEKESDDS